MTKAVMRSLVLIATLVLSAAGTVAAEDPVSSKVDEILAELRQLRILVQSLAIIACKAAYRRQNEPQQRM